MACASRSASSRSASTASAPAAANAPTDEQSAQCPLGIKGYHLSRTTIDKILAVAISPGAYDQEAIAALRKAREMVRQNPALAYPEPPPPPAAIALAPDHSIEFRATNVLPFYLNIFVGSLSQEAYGLGLRSKFGFDFAALPTAVVIRCDGTKAACDAFARYLHSLVEYINTHPPT
jgi:hypothetical protein